MNSIRISGGNLKGKKVYFDFNDSLRPTSNKLREILFNWIHFEFKQGFECLDLFAGTGALGFEAISRNANKVTFIELNKKHYLNIKNNISKLGLQDSSKIFFKDAFSWLKNYDLSDIDIIFLDPPFNKDYETKILNQLFKKKDLKPSCKIYLEYSKYNEIEIPKGFIVLKEKDVGDVKALLLIKDEN